MIIEHLREILGDKGLLVGADVTSRSRSLIESHKPCTAKAIVRPDSTDQLAAVMRLCHGAGQPIVPMGGGTGVVRGCVAGPHEIQLSLERMTVIEAIDTSGRTVTVQAGATLQAVQQAVADRGLFLPLDLGARGSATIGGNIATNAGGNRVFRYGMTRDMVLGLEAVLADGTVVSSLNHMIKNNAGYDIKQMFIGSEGTLGIVTRAVLRLREQPRSHNVALVALETFDKLKQFLKQIDGALGGSLSAFEVMWNNFYTMVTAPSAMNRAPLAGDYPYYVLVESMGGDQTADYDCFVGSLTDAMEENLIVDAVVAKSDSEREDFWTLRDSIEIFFSHKPWYGFDVSLKINDMAEYIRQVEGDLRSHWPAYKHIVFGHIADGNIHMMISAGGCSEGDKLTVERIIYGHLKQYGGSVSAEHGIGMEKKPYLAISRNKNEISVMRLLKTAFDPKDILNPGRVLE
ncbi:MAG: FAD-binding oxidoreductase [Alphaproteobacteria bacterium]|nr:MAG: FAD-binding oxidoreductase [Alphaproteobacteria bacterium]